MKKLIIVALFAMGAVFALSAEDSVDVSGVRGVKYPAGIDAPTGVWHDAKWDADWEFATNSIVLKKDGKVVYDFTNTAENFKASAGLNGVIVTFDCSETGRSYKFVKPISLDADLEMTIDRNDVPAKDPNKHYETKITWNK
ncbi:MAG: hypothetical protein K6A89_05835 [Treponema sp.]|nr:hypothetical protein [Treponema sp.]